MNGAYVQSKSSSIREVEKIIFIWKFIKRKLIVPLNKHNCPQNDSTNLEEINHF